MEHPAQPRPQPNDIAREAIKRLAQRKLPPTPENYRRAYLEVAGGNVVQAVWPEAIRALLQQWENYQAGLTQARKREMLDRVLINFATDPDQLSAKLLGLARSWGGAGAASTVLSGDNEAEETSAPPAKAGVTDAAPGGAEGYGRLISRYLEELCAGCRQRWPDLASRGDSLVRSVAGRAYLMQERDIDELAGLWREVLVRAEDDHVYLDGLKRLLGLLFRNVGELVSEDAWLSGQMAAMQAALAGQLNVHALYQAEESLKELVQRQKQLKGSMDEAKAKLKHLIAVFITRLGEMTDSTGQYNVRIKEYSSRIAQAEDLSELADVVDGLSTDMVRMEEDMGRTHQELLDARSHAEEAESRIHSLEKELEEVSVLVREDQLTGALNRRGLEEAFHRELARAQRARTPFAVALLDVDHFKRLNDNLGHQAGDLALVHLAKVIRKLLRPTDSLARYGGEEFLIMLPNSDLDEADKIMHRLQRELTKEYFMHDNQRVLITFSAGVAQLQEGESQAAIIGRTDAAMYRAKAAGRNRVERG